jgi:hypothetical protein
VVADSGAAGPSIHVRSGSLSSRLVRHVRINIHEHVVHATLRLAVAAPAVPAALARRSVLNLRQIEAAPFAAWRQSAAAFATELIDQCRFHPILVAEDVRTDLSIVSLVVAGDLLAIEDGAVKQPEDRAVTGADCLERLVAHAWPTMSSVARNIGALDLADKIEREKASDESRNRRGPTGGALIGLGAEMPFASYCVWIASKIPYHKL